MKVRKDVMTEGTVRAAEESTIGATVSHATTSRYNGTVGSHMREIVNAAFDGSCGNIPLLITDEAGSRTDYHYQ